MLNAFMVQTEGPGTGLRVLHLLTSRIHQEFVVLMILILPQVRRQTSTAGCWMAARKLNQNVFFNMNSSLWFKSGSC